MTVRIDEAFFLTFWYSESNSRHFERFGVAGLGVMLVGEGVADDEGEGGGAPGSEYLRLVSVLGRGAYGRVELEARRCMVMHRQI